MNKKNTTEQQISKENKTANKERKKAWKRRLKLIEPY